MSGIFLLMIITIGFGAASVLGPMEALQENSNLLFNNQESDDPPDLMELGHMIITDMQNLLVNQERSMEARLKQLELYVDHTCRDSGNIQRQQDSKVDFKGEMTQMLDGYMHYMLSKAHDFADNLQQQLDSKIELAMIKIEEKLSDITQSPKSLASETQSMNTSSSNKLAGINYQTLSVVSLMITDQLKRVITRTDLQKQTEHSDKQILSIISLLNNASSHQVLNYTKDIRDILYSFKPVYETFRTVVNKCDRKEDQFNQMERFEQLLQELKVEVDDNGKILSNMFLAIEDAEDMLTEKLTALESLTEQINNNSPQLQTFNSNSPQLQTFNSNSPQLQTFNSNSPQLQTFTSNSPQLQTFNSNSPQLQTFNSNNPQLQTSSAPTPVPSPTGSMGEMSECKDSDFLGGKHKIDICSAAVRYNKCQIHGVAYHCCRTCTDAGQLSDVGPHRYLTYPRKISLFGGMG